MIFRRHGAHYDVIISFLQRIRTLCQPTEEWGPASESRRQAGQVEWQLPLTKDEAKDREDVEMATREPGV